MSKAVVIVKCKTCGNDIHVFRSSAKTKKFCSMNCRNIDYAKRRGPECGFFGKHQTETTKIRMSNIRRLYFGHVNPPSRSGTSPWNKGKTGFVPWNKGKRCPILSLVQKGERGPNWKGGRSNKNRLLRSSAEFAWWRQAVFIRDRFTCRKCGARGGQLHPHHIKSFAEYPLLRFDVNNGLTLCVPCHQMEHKKIKLSAV